MRTTAKFFTVDDVAETLGVDVQTVRRWIHAGHLRAFKPGKEYRIQESDLEEFLRAREVRPKVPSGSPSEPTPNDALAEERRVDVYTPWLEVVNRYADRWEERIEASDLDRGSVNEFIATLEDIGRTLGPLGGQERREQPEDYLFSFGPVTGKAVSRLSDLLEAVLRAWEQKFGDTELERLRRRKAETEAAFFADARRESNTP